VNDFTPLWVYLLLFVLTANSLAATEPAIVSTNGSERATVGDGNKIVTYHGKTHVVWQDISSEGYLNQVRSFVHKTNEWTEPVTLGHGVDNHARPIMTIDHDGYLHVILSGHNSPVLWRQSVRPNDSSAWTEPVEVGEGTYPVLLCDRENNLYMTMRANNHAGVDLFKKPASGKWSKINRIVKNAEKYREAYAAFHMQMAFGPDGVLHAVIDFYEGQDEVGRGFHQAVCYLKSPDGGKTWQKADGTLATTPARPEDMDILVRSTESRVERLPKPEYRNDGIVVDSKGKPYVFYTSHSDAPGQLYMATLDKNNIWQKRSISYLLELNWPGMRNTGGKITIQEDDRICAFMTLTPFNDEWIEGRPTRAMHMQVRTDQRLVLVSSADGGKTFEANSILEPGATYNAPNMEKPSGANRVARGAVPPFLYFGGSSAYPGGGDYYEKPVSEYLKAGEFWTNEVFLFGLPK
jgi:hypothetical protein